MDLQAARSQALDRLAATFVTSLEEIEDTTLALELLQRGLQVATDSGELRSFEFMNLLRRLSDAALTNAKTCVEKEKKQYWLQITLAIGLAATIVTLLMDSAQKEVYSRTVQS